MPLYEYRCTQCGHRFEKIQSFSAEPEVVCPKCGGTLERPLTAPALQFKGAGWYINDYAPKAASSSADKPASDAAPAAGGESKPATEAKPAAESKPAASESTTKPAPSTPSTSTT